jgi:hypothetical protein
MFKKCKHEWKILSEITTESHMEQQTRLLGSAPKYPMSWAFEKKLIQILTCSKCGKLKRFVTNI